MWAEMKPTGKHPEKRLNAASVNAAKKPGRYADGNCLYLVVDPSGAKRWLLRTNVQGVRRDISLGSVRLVSLKEARETAVEYRKIARRGGDPVALRKKAQRVIPTFAEAAEKVHGDHSATWKNKKHAAQWISSLRAYAFPAFGETGVDRIDTPAILKVLAPIWLTKAETARRVKQRIGTVLDWATAVGFRDGENPINGVAKGLPRQPDKKAHYKAMPYADIPAFINWLGKCDLAEQTQLALEFLILTATRTGEVINLEWPEIEINLAMWTVPSERMKNDREHRVPLSTRSIEILDRAKMLGAGSKYVFPGRSPSKPISNETLWLALRRMEAEATVHGFRSAFRDWAAERTNVPRDVCEMALAHSIQDKTEAAYRRGDLFEKRRELMETWASYVVNTDTKIVRLRARGDGR